MPGRRWIMRLTPDKRAEFGVLFARADRLPPRLSALRFRPLVTVCFEPVSRRSRLLSPALIPAPPRARRAQASLPLLYRSARLPRSARHMPGNRSGSRSRESSGAALEQFIMQFEQSSRSARCRRDTGHRNKSSAVSSCTSFTCGTTRISSGSHIRYSGAKCTSTLARPSSAICNRWRNVRPTLLPQNENQYALVCSFFLRQMNRTGADIFVRAQAGFF